MAIEEVKAKADDAKAKLKKVVNPKFLYLNDEPNPPFIFGFELHIAHLAIFNSNGVNNF